MLEHGFGLYRKAMLDQNKCWELLGNSIWFNENIQ